MLLEADECPLYKLLYRRMRSLQADEWPDAARMSALYRLLGRWMRGLMLLEADECTDMLRG